MEDLTVYMGNRWVPGGLRVVGTTSNNLDIYIYFLIKYDLLYEAIKFKYDKPIHECFISDKFP